MTKLLTLFLAVVLTFSACSSENDKEIVISTNEWIGYTPLFYAYEKGELDKLHFKLIKNVSLAEAANLYAIKKADMVTTTQHEYHSLQATTHDIVPIILMDRSNGGDMVLSNKSTETLKNSPQIYAYLEIDSINKEILIDFISHNKIDKNKIIFINKDQKQIQNITNDKTKDILIVTYSPYNIALEEKGFQEVASTKSINSIIVIDALCARDKIIKTNKRRLIQLKKVLDNAINTIEQDPQASYKVVAKYLSNISYKEYLNALKQIKWINKPSEEFLDYIQQYGYKKETIIR